MLLNSVRAVRIGRTLPPAATPIRLRDIVAGLSGIFEGNAVIDRFERELKDFYRVRHCFTVSSGRAALVLLLQAMHELLPDRDEVLIPAYTCYSVPSAIVKAGLKVRLCDLAAGSLDFDFDLLGRELENPRTLCVVPTHLFGCPADVARAKDMLACRRIFVLEDAAQAMGAEWNGRKMGTQGDAAVFSMGRGKAFSTVEGGIILTDNDSLGALLARRVSVLKGAGTCEHLRLVLQAFALWALVNPRIYWLPKSLPFLHLGETHFDTSFAVTRFTRFQAGAGLGWKAKLDGFKSARGGNARTLAGYGLPLPGASADADLIRYPLLAVDAEAKKGLLHRSDRLGLGIGAGYPDSIDGIEELRGSFSGRSFPQARKTAERLVSLPIHPLVAPDDLARIARSVKGDTEIGEPRCSRLSRHSRDW